MQRLGDHVLSGTGFTGNQYSYISRRCRGHVPPRSNSSVAYANVAAKHRIALRELLMIPICATRPGECPVER